MYDCGKLKSLAIRIFLYNCGWIKYGGGYLKKKKKHCANYKITQCLNITQIIIHVRIFFF